MKMVKMSPFLTTKQMNLNMIHKEIHFKEVIKKVNQFQIQLLIIEQNARKFCLKIYQMKILFILLTIKFLLFLELIKISNKKESCQLITIGNISNLILKIQTRRLEMNLLDKLMKLVTISSIIKIKFKAFLIKEKKQMKSLSHYRHLQQL